MTRALVLGDEAGNFSFSGKPGSSRYFIVTAVTLQDDSACRALFDLGRELLWSGRTDSHFHAQADPYEIRESVYDLLAEQDLRVDAIILEKVAASEELRRNNLRLWSAAWRRLLHRVAPAVAPAPSDELVVIASSLTTKRITPPLARASLEDVVRQTARCETHLSDVWPTTADPGLQIADYCCWAIQRKWEHSRDDAYRLIERHVASEVRLF